VSRQPPLIIFDRNYAPLNTTSGIHQSYPEKARIKYLIRLYAGNYKAEAALIPNLTGNKSHPLGKGGGNKQAVKRITVKPWQPFKDRKMSDRNRDNGNIVGPCKAAYPAGKRPSHIFLKVVKGRIKVFRHPELPFGASKLAFFFPLRFRSSKGKHRRPCRKFRRHIDCQPVAGGNFYGLLYGHEVTIA
jgi:hypothetical protein